MLKRFAIENFSSYYEKNYLDLTADKTGKHSNHVYDFKKVKILKSAIIYGANASGKSNIIKALDYSRDIILNGLENIETYKKYFRLNKDAVTKPTLFEFELEINDNFYSYGFSAILEKNEIEEEWLYEIGKSTPSKVFERNNREITIGKLLSSNSDIRNRFEIYIDDMKNQSNQLFLTEIANKNLDYEEVSVFNSLYNWFKNKLTVIYPETNNKSYIKTSNKDFYKKFLEKFDTGIQEITYIEEDFDDTLREAPKELKKDIEKILEKEKRIYLRSSQGHLLSIYKDDNKKLKIERIAFLHGHDSKEIFELNEESDGTQRLFDLIPLIEKFSEDYTIVIDEFDRSLHPNLTKKFFELFYSLSNNKTQLIASTHESTLLDLKLVRRDEIWFVKKDKNGASKTYPLNQFDIRHDKKIDKDYLLGRFEATPVINIYDELIYGE